MFFAAARVKNFFITRISGNKSLPEHLPLKLDI